MILSSYEAIYDRGKLTWLGEEPVVDRARVIVTVLAGDSPAPVGKAPDPGLKSTLRTVDDGSTPAIDPAEWEASLERTARQIAGEQDAFTPPASG